MSGQHTPGPWRVNDSDGAGNCGSDIFPFLVEAGTPEHSEGPVIAEVYGDLANLPALANARLIAASPDMLEALEAIVEGLGATVENDGTKPIWAAAFAAIAKAKGIA